jgi:hypothetical protein
MRFFGRTNPIPKRSRRRANCAQAFVAGPAVFPLYFQRAALPRNPRRGRTIPEGDLRYLTRAVANGQAVAAIGERLKKEGC